MKGESRGSLNMGSPSNMVCEKKGDLSQSSYYNQGVMVGGKSNVINSGNLNLTTSISVDPAGSLTRLPTESNRLRML